jgi:hypothetical protein
VSIRTAGIRVEPERRGFTRTPVSMQQNLQRAPSPLGCLGAVLGCVAVVYGLTLLAAPWAFFIGGRFTPFMMWHGHGIFAAGPDSYSVFVDLAYQPAGGSGPDDTSDLEGTALVCGANGIIQEWRARLETDRIWVSTSGENTTLHLTRPTGRYRDGAVEQFDIVDLPGVWSGPGFTLRDNGSLAAFAGSHRAVAVHTAMVSYGSRQDFEAVCRAGRRIQNAP